MSSPSKFFFVFDPAYQQNYTAEVAIQAFEPLRPIVQNPQIIVYRTRFLQLRAYYKRPVQNAAHPDLPQVYFADDVDYQNRPGGLLEWTRVYTTLPTSWNDFESYPYEYPGYQGTLLILGRQPFTHTVTSKLVKDYFMVGTLPSFSNLLANYDDATNASWQKFGTNAIANAAEIPVCAGGATNAAKICEDLATSIHIVGQASNAAAGTVAGAVFVQAAERKKVRVGFGITSATAPFADVLVDLVTGNPTNNGLSNYAVAAVGDGWWRVDVVGNAANTNTALIVALCDDNGNVSYTGDNASGLYVWRGQMVAGGTVPHATVAPTTTPDGTNYPISQSDLIPFKFGTRYLYQVPWGYSTNAVATQFVAEYLSDGGFGLVATNPTLSGYKASVTADNANTNSYSIEATDSVQTLWLGGIWQRTRRFVKAI